MKIKIREIGAAFLILALFSSCVSTYNTVDVDIISDSPENGSIHYVRKSENIKSKNSFDGKLLAYYTFGYPFVVFGCTVRETGRVAGYSALNLLLGAFSYSSIRNGDEDANFSFAFPNTKKARQDYLDFQEEYQNSDLYKYRKYRKILHKAEIAKQDLIEEIDWNDETKVISSTSETIKVQASVGKSAAQVSKKASLIGSRIGAVTSVVFAVPSYIVGFAVGAYLESSGD